MKPTRKWSALLALVIVLQPGIARAHDISAWGGLLAACALCLAFTSIVLTAAALAFASRFRQREIDPEFKKTALFIAAIAFVLGLGWAASVGLDALILGIAFSVPIIAGIGVLYAIAIYCLKRKHRNAPSRIDFAASDAKTEDSDTENKEMAEEIQRTRAGLRPPVPPRGLKRTPLAAEDNAQTADEAIKGGEEGPVSPSEF